MFLLFIFCIVSVASSNVLISTVVIHRHGDRNPFTSYKTDPYKDESHWPEGLGQLTKRGIQRQYELGLWLKNRYNSFLPSKYAPKSIKVVSTDVDRTLMSAELTLAGVFPPLEDDKFDRNINWQPIPIHTAPSHQDAFLAMKKYCRKYQKMFDDLLKSKDITEINQISQNLYDFLSNKTGETMEDVYDVEIIHNTLHSQFLANKTLPDWAFEVYPDKMKAAVVLRYKLPCYNKELARLRTGLLLGEVVGNFRSFVDAGKGVKVFLLSGHDSTLADVMTALGVFNEEVPPYSSAILMELYQNSEGHYVNLLLKNSTGLYDLFLKSCSFNCNFEDFRRILEPIVLPNVEEWEKECEN